MTEIDENEDHERWSELAAGHALSALDEGDEAAYLEHASTCSVCARLERDFGAVVRDLSPLVAALTPPPELKQSIMRSIADDAERATPLASLADRRPTGSPARNGRSAPRRWLAVAAAAAVLAAVGVSVGLAATAHHGTGSVAARCAQVHCPTIQLDAAGQPVAVVMVLDHHAYVQAAGLPATPTGKSYVLWWISRTDKPVAVDAVRTRPGAGPVRVGGFTTPMTDVAAFALSEEPGSKAPAQPSQVLASGSVS